MTIKEFFPAAWKAIKVAAKKVVDAVMGASVVGLAKFGLIIGSAAAAVAFIVKFIKDRKKAYNDRSNMTTVDRSLELNYHDIRNQEELHPVMDKVKKALTKDLYGKKKGKKIIKKLDKQNSKRKSAVYGYTPEEVDEIETNYRMMQFLDQYPKWYKKQMQKGYQPHDGRLRFIWENTREAW